MSMAANSWVKDVTEESFESDVIAASDTTPVVIDFWSPRCAPCRTLGPMLERLTQEREGRVILAKVNTDENPRLASYFGVEAIPSIKVIYQKQLVHGFDGLLPEAALREFFDEIVPDGADEEIRQTQEIETKSPEEAEKHYRHVIETDPEKLEARVGLARVLLQQGRTDEIPAILETVGSAGEVGSESDRLLAQVNFLQASAKLPDEKQLRAMVASEPKNAQAHLDLGTVFASHGDFEAALKELFCAAELDFKLASGPARERMVQVFYALGTNHPLANDYRSRLSRLLY
ncbi:MAG: tetratricopeptide repeat protein [Gemmataceae bacterium]